MHCICVFVFVKLREVGGWGRGDFRSKNLLQIFCILSIQKNYNMGGVKGCLFFSLQKNINFGKSKRPQESLEDPEYNSNVNSAILDSSENTTLVHTNQMNRVYIHQYKFWMQRMQFYVCLETQLLDTTNIFEMGPRVFTGSEIPFKCKQCFFRFK